MGKKVFLGIIIISVVLAILIGSFKPNNTSAYNKSLGGKHIAVVRVEGMIVGGKQESVFGGITATSEDIMQNLRNAAADPMTGAILVRLNSPGGSAPASQEIGEEIKKIRKKYGIPIVTSMGDVAASGGYWIACTTDKIVANPSTMTGSIGVIMETQSWQELYDKLGIKVNNIKSGAHKDMGSTSRELTSAEQQLLQGMVNDIYEQFVNIVSEGRNISRENVKKIADGRIFTGRQAQNLKLVDKLGNYYDAIDYTKELAGLGQETQIKEYNMSSPWDIFKMDVQTPAQQNTLLKFVSDMLQIKGVSY